MAPTLTALAGFAAWSLFLLVLMEVLRGRLVLTKAVPANEFRPDNANLSPFMQRLARAHANCMEGLPVFGGLMPVAVLAGRSSITDPLAFTLLGARIVQSGRGGQPALRGVCGADGDRRGVGFPSAGRVANT
jgi:uncharacterized MAPEG superfamily protein